MKTLHFKQIVFLALLAPLLAIAGVQKPLTIRKIIQRSTKNDTLLCAEVDRYFSASDGILAKPYIKLTPNVRFTVTLSYDEICLSNLSPNTKYTFSINKQIPLGEVGLDKTYQFTESTSDYDPSLAFKDSGYILPAKGDIAIPIKTTNIDKLSISLYRINHRNLISSINQYGFFKNLSSYKLKNIEAEEGYMLWKKRLSITSKKNRVVTTAIPVGDFLKKREAGVYLLSAMAVNSKGEEDEYNTVTQWFMVSDMGLFTLEGDKGLRVYTKHLSSANLYNDVRLELVSKNNEILGSRYTKGGYAMFPKALLLGKDGLKPKAVYAYGADGDFTVLDLSRPAHNLSDRGVSGRKSIGKYDAWIYSNRGIFRPGESVPFHILARTNLGDALGSLKLSAKLYDSGESEVDSKLLILDDSGHAEGSFSLTPGMDTGKWKIKISAGSGAPLCQLDFLVEDFVPPKISLEINQKPQYIIPRTSSTIRATASYLTGDVLPDADVSREIILHHTKKPFQKYTDYHFGKAGESFDNVSLGEQSYKGDENGTIELILKPEYLSMTSLPLAARITMTVNEPGGRPVQRFLDIPYIDKPSYIGIKANFKNSAVDMDAKAIFNIIYLKNTEASAGDLTYRLIEEEVYWNWRSSEDGDWEYYKTYSDSRELKHGLVAVADHPTQLDIGKLGWGNYRLELSDNQEVVSSYRFTSGFEESISRSSPDRLPVSVDKQHYSNGDKVTVSITPKFTGPIIVSVANHEIIQTKELNATDGKRAELEFYITKAWGSSSYILASAFRAQSKRLGATRAIGVAHISIIDPHRNIPLTLDYPKRLKSSSKLDVHIETTKKSKSKIYLTVAAVDNGVLNITDYDSPDPAKYFYSKRALGIEIKDIYADLIKTVGAHGEFDTGAGDDELPPTLGGEVAANKRKVLALFSKVVALNSEGQATLSFDIPDFQGSLRLMAVAWSKDGVGSSIGEVIIKDPISPELYMPKFISHGDVSTMLLRSSFDDNIEDGVYQFKIRTEGGINVSPLDINYTLSKSNSKVMNKSLTLQANKQEDGVILLDILHNTKRMISRKWEIGVRAAYPQNYVKNTGLLEGGKALDSKVILETNTSWINPKKIKLKLSSAPLLPVGLFTKELVEYMGRCAEQTTSRAMPWLNAKDKTHSGIIQSAIDRVTSMQKIDGGVGLWGSSDAQMWITAYVMDFLTLARSKGYKVPKKNIDLGLKWLETHLNRWSDKQKKQEADVYALYVLARSGKILHSEIMYHVQNSKNAIRSAQAWGHLGATLSLLGEKDKAVQVFEKARHALVQNGRDFYSNYGGTLRDKASLISLLKESHMSKEAEELFVDLVLDVKQRKYLSTQELSTLIRADLSVDTTSDKLNISVDGKTHNQDQAFELYVDNLTELPKIVNLGAKPLWYNLSFIATANPSGYNSKENNGFSITKQLYDMKGNTLSIDQIKRNSRVVVVLKGEIQSNNIKHPLITDWLPAGLEVENPNIGDIDATDSLKWLGKKSGTLHNEYRNDRFESALKVEDNNSFCVAYIARAVTVGRYTMVPAKIEDMYQPRYRAFSSFYNKKLAVKNAGDIVVKVETKTTENNASEAPLILTSEIYQEVYKKPIKDLKRYSLVQLNYLRNGIFAQAGLGFEQSNPSLHKRFSVFGWYRATEDKSSAVYASLNTIQKQNVQKLLREEKLRCAGLVLADFYRSKIRQLDESYLKKYSKKQLRILRNSLIARYGLRFKDMELTKIFSQMPWYKPTDITASEIIDKRMNDLERKNMLTMLKVERQK